MTDKTLQPLPRDIVSAAILQGCTHYMGVDCELDEGYYRIGFLKGGDLWVIALYDGKVGWNAASWPYPIEGDHAVPLVIVGKNS